MERGWGKAIVKLGQGALPFNGSGDRFAFGRNFNIIHTGIKCISVFIVGKHFRHLIGWPVCDLNAIGIVGIVSFAIRTLSPESEAVLVTRREGHIHCGHTGRRIKRDVVLA